jgi:type IV pilus assembly protein PilB
MKHFRKTTNKHLGELLVERGILTRQQVQEAVDHQKTNGGLFGEVLVKLGYATEENIAQALTTQYGFPYLPLANYEIDVEVIKTVPENVCRQFCLIPIDKIGKSLTLAMSNPLNVQAAEDVELITGCTVQAFVATATDIKSSINKYYSLNK